MEDVRPGVSANRGNSGQEWLKKHDLGMRDNQNKDGTLAIMPASHVANIVETLEGKAVGETTPQKNQMPKRHKSGAPEEELADSRVEDRRAQ